MLGRKTFFICFWFICIGIGLIFAFSASAGKIEAVPGKGPDSILLMQARAIFGKLPTTMPGSEEDTPEMIELGRMLYFEDGMSVNKTQSCNDCHPIDQGRSGADYHKTSQGAKGRFGPRNSPTTLNAGFQIAQFWDGRSPDLADQATGPILNPVEMGMSGPKEVVARVKSMEDKYRAPFEKTFPDSEEAIQIENIGRAIAAFERTLISKGKFDRFMEGYADALSDLEKEGLRNFMDEGCVRCHSGPVLGGMLYQKIGVYHPYANTEDLGRHDVTQKESDKYVFKVPVLRNVTLTAPYFHDGQVANLGEAVDLMAYLQLDKELNNGQIDSILRFLTAVADVKRTSANPPQTAGAQIWWNPPSTDGIPEGEKGDLIRYGRQLVSDTYAHLGPDVKDPNMRYTGNVLACRNCHQESGTKQFGIPWMGVSYRYPRYRSREDMMASLEDRINGCFERSMNGKALPKESREMKAIVAYMNWLTRDVPKDYTGQGTPEFDTPYRRADLDAGAQVYTTHCQACHGLNGSGYQARSAGENGSYVVPPLWGNNSYNNGAGMHRVLTAAAFVRANMPLGTPWEKPALSDEDAYDVGAYINSFDRPVKVNLEADWPDRWKKRVDCPYPPYADDFHREQHKYGPFQPIKEVKEAVTSEKNKS